MPNFDAGHYFLTMLAPVKLGMSEIAGKPGFSYRQTVLDTLARMQNSEISTGSLRTIEASPFARNTMTHLARFVLIDAPPYNGRVSGDTLLSKLFTKDNPLSHQPVDEFGCSYLLFAADFDAKDGSDEALRFFTDTLWQTMAAELRPLFGQCYGFEEVSDAAGFFDYVKKCQVETTMPFNDYWRGTALPKDLPLPLADGGSGSSSAGLPWRQIVIGGLGLWVICVLGALFLPETSRMQDIANWIARWGLLAIVLIIIGAGIFIWSLYRKVMKAGAQVYPPGATLPDVLKSLYLQQSFLEFVVANQGKDDAALQIAFGEFAAGCRPENEAAPTQRPGVIRVPAETLCWPPQPPASSSEGTVKPTPQLPRGGATA